MVADDDLSGELAERVVGAVRNGTALAIVGHGSKAFYGRAIDAERLNIAGHRGVVHYDPRELIVTVRAGTPLAELQHVLGEAGQGLAFEPPLFGGAGTVGGAIAAGLSGPARPYRGGVRDFVLGARILDGRGEDLRFGGEVMKNVAGYDVSRLMVGALGCLGVLLEVSLKVLPVPETIESRVLEVRGEEVAGYFRQWAKRALPLSGACYDGTCLYIRLAGAPQAVVAARQRIGGETLEEGDRFWQCLRDHELSFFEGEGPLWRLSVAPLTAPLGVSGHWLVDWGGAQRWLRSDEPAERIRDAAQAVGGHATLFRGGDRTSEVFQDPGAGARILHQRLKASFDPQGVLNPGRFYSFI